MNIAVSNSEDITMADQDAQSSAGVENPVICKIQFEEGTWMFVWLKLGVKYVTLVNMHQQPTTQVNEE